MPIALDELRAFAVTRSLFPPTTLERAIDRLGFVQADPIRAPARAQDLTLRHRVAGYRAGDLERRYEALRIEEDVFINYGFVTRDVHALMHPRTGAPRTRQSKDLLTFVRERGVVHPRDAHAHFAHGTVTNYWGGSSNATTHLLDRMHYHGMLRVARRAAGIRIYSPREHAPAPLTAAAIRSRIDALIDVVVNLYGPATRTGVAWVVNRLRYAVPQWRRELRSGLNRALERLSHATVEGVGWYWPSGERLRADVPDAVRLLSPFDPVVWDRRRFEQLWGWPYRFEAYTPAARRERGYYALPLLWRDRVVGWGNVSWQSGELRSDFGFAGRRPSEPAFRRELADELERMRGFLTGTADTDAQA